MSKAKRTTQINTLITKEREDGWYIPPVPTKSAQQYDAERDKNCPRAQMVRFNKEKKSTAQKHAEKGKGCSDWLKTAIQSNFTDVPLKINTNFRTKAMSVNELTGFNKDSLAEVDILQKVIVRENFLSELRKLIENSSDVSNCLGEVGEIIKAIRFQTVDIVESIDAWQKMQLSPLPFLYRGENYLLKIASDLDYLDQYDDIVERFCFEFRFNPLAYRGGGDIIVGLPSRRLRFVGKNENTVSTYLSTDMFLDGVEVFRLRNAENVIQLEFDRVDKVEQQRRVNASSEANLAVGGGGGSGLAAMNAENTTGATLFLSSSVSALPPLVAANPYAAEGNKDVDAIQQAPKSVPSNNGNSSRSKLKPKFNSTKVKMERIAALNDEADELKAVETHIEDKIVTLVNKHSTFTEKRAGLERARQEALYLDKVTAANHLNVEITVLTSDIQNINAEIKDMQRQIYFVTLERKRKRRLARTLQDELNDEKRRKKLEAKLSAEIKKVGVLAAVKNFNAAMIHGNANARIREASFEDDDESEEDGQEKEVKNVGLARESSESNEDATNAAPDRIPAATNARQTAAKTDSYSAVQPKSKITYVDDEDNNALLSVDSKPVPENPKDSEEILDIVDAGGDGTDGVDAELLNLKISAGLLSKEDIESIEDKYRRMLKEYESSRPEDADLIVAQDQMDDFDGDGNEEMGSLAGAKYSELLMQESMSYQQSLGKYVNVDAEQEVDETGKEFSAAGISDPLKEIVSSSIIDPVEETAADALSDGINKEENLCFTEGIANAVALSSLSVVETAMGVALAHTLNRHEVATEEKRDSTLSRELSELNMDYSPVKDHVRDHAEQDEFQFREQEPVAEEDEGLGAQETFNDEISELTPSVLPAGSGIALVRALHELEDDNSKESN